MTRSKRLEVGERAPDFELVDQSGEVVSLARLRERGPVVLFFYPKDETPVCTVEACAFRDVSQTLRDAGAVVVGISRDDRESHARFAERHSLPFSLLSDPGGTVAASYGVHKTFGLPGRATFVLDRDGVVRASFSSQLRARRHVEVALDAVRRLVQPVSASAGER